MKRFVRVVPSIRTVPGVEEFDYSVPDLRTTPDALRPGDLIRVPFRNRPVPALVIATSDASEHEKRAIVLEKPEILLRLGPAAVALLIETSQRCFSSQPSVLHAWIRAVPKRIRDLGVTPVPPTAGGVQNRTLDSSRQRRDGNDKQLSLDRIDNRFLVDRWSGKKGLLAEAKKSRGRVLILTPWKHRAEFLAERLKTNALHADLAMGACWSGISSFATEPSGILVATRIGAWLSAVADVVLVDEPENDDHKQDELAPRYDARWIVERCAESRSDLRVITFGTTPRLGENGIAPTIDVNVRVEGWKKRSGSAVELLSPKTVTDIEAAIAEERDVFILHPLRGVRSRMTCHDCGWSARCPACGFTLSLGERHTFCKRCGRRADVPATCPMCGGSDFSRGMPGVERLAEQCRAYFKSDRVRVIDLMEFDRLTCDVQTFRLSTHLIVLTDLSLLAGAAEDIRRRERLIIAWRRVAAGASRLDAQLLVQGPEELLAECRSWLSADGLRAAWKKELEERKMFGFPPAVSFVKILVDGTEHDATDLLNELGSEASGPYPVPYRAATRRERWVIHVRPMTFDFQTFRLSTRLEPFKRRCFIDLDPIAFFS